ncbi:MAG: hypothetical protein Q8Q08_02555 [Candidatus Omnitrophota bacterium]|nr:hypothetical protein [Candidatus Omnitrophota bacterium]MDZ4243431.1 hypothetical protein [Candidatus Omnitrophota bacterium]
MPFYDYFCEANGETVEVMHAMSVRLKTWGDLCRHAGRDPGKTPVRAPVVRLISGVTPQVFRLKGLDKDAPAGNKLSL